MRLIVNRAVVALLFGVMLPAAARCADLDRIQALAEGGPKQKEQALALLDDLRVDETGQLEERFLRALVLADLGRNDGARDAFAALSREFARPEPAHNLAVIEARSGKPAVAVRALQELLDDYPDYELAAENLAKIRQVASARGFDPLHSDEVPHDFALTRRLESALGARRALSAPVRSVPRVAVAGGERDGKSAEESRDEEPEARPVEPPAAPAEDLEPSAPAREPKPEPAGPVATGVTAMEAEPEPAATTEEAAPAVEGLRAELERSVSAWAAAWSEQRVEDYLGFYSSDFEPAAFASREAWEGVRRRRVTTPSFIEVEIDFDSMTVRDIGPGLASVTFVQSYRSDRFSDTVRKTLKLAREYGIWRIRTETSE